MSSPKPCREEGCARPKVDGKHRCYWHHLAAQPIAVQVANAQARLERAEAFGVPKRTRVDPSEWPNGERWCAGCQFFVPIFYTRGSRCRACASVGAHESHLKRTYGISREDYDRLLAWQGGRCYICQQVPRSKRLAVDHDHVTGQVRGLLCANDEFGCNVTLRRLLNDVTMAKRAMAYVTMTPWERLKREDPPGSDWYSVTPASQLTDEIRVPDDI